MGGVTICHTQGTYQFGMSTSRRVLLQVTLFWMSSEIASWIKSVPRSIIYSILLANREQEHGPLQTFGPANGVSTI